MTLLMSRVDALLGGFAQAIGRLVGSIIWFAPRGIPWALVVAGLVALGAWQSLEAARVITATQPRPEPAALADIIDLRATGWVGTSTIVRGPFLDSSAYGAPIQRWYYLLLDPVDDGVAMVARSAERLEERRTRTIVARVDSDPEAVAAALDVLDPGWLDVQPDRYLVELPERPVLLTGETVVTPGGDLMSQPEVVLRGSFEVARPAASGEAWEYLVRGSGRAVVVRSPYPPDALPVDVWGIPATDPVRAEQAASVPALRAVLDGRRLPDRRLLAEGVTPPLPEASYAPAIILASLACLVLVGWLLGYPIFRRRPASDRISTWPMRPGDEIQADLYGTDRRGPGRVVVNGAPARLALLAPDELERRSWQFALGHAAGAAPVTTGGQEPPAVLALSTGEGPILLRLDGRPPNLMMVDGVLMHVSGPRPAIRLRADTVDLVAAFGSVEERDRAIAAIEPARRGAERDGSAPARQPAAPLPAAGDVLPVPLRAAAAALAVVGGALVVDGGIGLPGMMAGDGPAWLPSLAQLASGIGVAAVGRGVWLRRGWAEGIGFTVGWVGAAIAAFLIVAAPQCGLWLAPNLAACQAIGPVGSAAALGASIALGYAALTIRRHAAAFGR